MKRIVAFTSILAITATAGWAQERTYDFTDFNSIEATAGVEVNVTLGGDFAVSAEAKRGDIADLDISLDGKTLTISREATSGGWSLFNFGASNDAFVVTVAMPDIVGLETASGAAIRLDGTTQTLETVDASSGSTINVRQAALDMVRIDVSSGSEVTMTGTCEELAVDTSSGSMVNADGLQCGVVDVSASSGSGVSTYAMQSVTADGSSGASIRISGDASDIDTSTSSGASITRN